MITSTRQNAKLNILNDNPAEKPKIMFLNVDSSLTQDPYSLSEHNHFISNRDYETYGKIEIYSDRTKYFLKTFRGGRPGEYLINPFSAFAKREDLSTVSTARGGRFTEYSEFSKYHFDVYVNYLKGRNEINFRLVEKAFVNGEAMSGDATN